MRNFECLKTELLHQGIQITEITTVKNGISCHGFRIVDATSNSNIFPVVYYSEQETLSEIADRIFDAVHHIPFDIKVDGIMNRSYMLSHVFVGIQRRSSDDAVKKEFLNLDVILRVYLDYDHGSETGTIKVTDSLLKAAGISADELWLAAMDNSRSQYRIDSMAELLGIPGMYDQGMYVVRSDKLVDAASALLFPEIFRDFCNKQQTEQLFILPSSTQEVIMLTGELAERFGSGQELVTMVDVINQEQVDPIIQLEPCVYLYRTDTNDVSVLACMKGDV